MITKVDSLSEIKSWRPSGLKPQSWEAEHKPLVKLGDCALVHTLSE